ncbi:MAG: DUF4129 domain-containing protein [Lentisphaeria bacterium]|nr:DUF4129 domain-containing protein [Lentisphaeria bacterium]
MAARPLTTARSPDPPALELLDRAFHLLRTRPAALGAYALGSLPFALGLLFFWSDMSRSAFAEERAVGEALLLTVLYVWMKVWQSRFMMELLGEASLREEPPWPLWRYLRAALQQVTIQATAPVALLAAGIVLLPSAWCVAFYHSATLFGNGRRTRLGTLVRDSWGQARLWPRQNHALLAVASAFALFVFLEILVGLFVLPELLRRFTGVETVFSRSGRHLLNSTFLAAAAMLTYLVVDPLLRAAYVLRCFQGQALSSGEDVRTGLMEARSRRRRTGLGTALAILAPVLLAGLCGPSASAAAAPEPIPPPRLEEAVRRTISQPRYTWRMPRERLPSEAGSRGPIERFLDRIGEWMRSAWRWGWERLRDLASWLRRVLRQSAPREDAAAPSLSAWKQFIRILLIGLTALGLLALLLYGWVLWRRRRHGSAAAVEAETVAEPDLASEATTADQLPAGDWLELARRLMAEGALRRGIRAAYLAAIAYLADRQVLTVARHKSNLDYRRELARRAHQLPEVVRSFDANVRTFDRVWYGTHTATDDDAARFLEHFERMRKSFEP